MNKPLFVNQIERCWLIGGNLCSLETLIQFILDELRSPLVPLVSVLIVNGTVMLLRVLAAFEYQAD